MSHALTDEQQAIVRAAAEGEFLRGQAFAGTGKTSTCVAVAKEVPRSILYMAFNRANADEGKARFPRNTDSRTGHSLAYRPTIGRVFRKDRLQKGMMPVLRALEDHPVSYPLREMTKGDKRAAGLVLVRTLGAWVQSADDRPTREHVPAAFGAKIKDRRERAKVEGVAAKAAGAAWDAIVEPGSEIPITFDFYLKAWALTRPLLPYDLILHDEAQDANPVILGLLAHQEAQIIHVGDSHQQIYSFRGAVDAMANAHGNVYPLTKSWRFGPEVAAVANEVLSLLGEERPLIGGGPAGVATDEPGVLKPGGAVLCRGNAGVLTETLAGLDAGRRVAVVGGVEETVRLLDASYVLWDGRRPNHPELGLFDSWLELQGYAETDDGSSYRPIVRIVEDYRHDVPALSRRLQAETVDEKRADLIVSTAHKAKGREWDEVLLAQDFPPLVELDSDNRPHFRREEANLGYVTVTRAMKRLYLNGYRSRLAEARALLGRGEPKEAAKKPRDDRDGPAVPVPWL